MIRALALLALLIPGAAAAQSGVRAELAALAEAGSDAAALELAVALSDGAWATLFARAFASQGCVLADEAALNAGLAQALGMTPGFYQANLGAVMGASEDVFDAMLADGRVVVDQAARTVTLVDCTP